MSSSISSKLIGGTEGAQSIEFIPFLWTFSIIWHDHEFAFGLYSCKHIEPSDTPHKTINPYSCGANLQQFTEAWWLYVYILSCVFRFDSFSFHIINLLSNPQEAKYFPKDGWQKDKSQIDCSWPLFINYDSMLFSLFFFILSNEKIFIL